MSSINPQEYYENEENLGSYVYVSLEEIVERFIDNFTGNGTLIGKPNRRKIIYQAKQGIKQFTINALKEFKGVELEMNETLDVILPPDYVNYVRISFVNPQTGELMVLSRNYNAPLATSYLQDNDANILFDDDGFILQGTTYFDKLNDSYSLRNIAIDLTDTTNSANYNLNPTINSNGTFNIDTRQGRIHFSSDNASNVIMLEYVSDGLEYLSEADIKVSKLAEQALLYYINFHLMLSEIGIPMYEKKQAEKLYRAEYKNAKIKMMDVKISDTMLFLNAKRAWLR